MASVIGDQTEPAEVFDDSEDKLLTLFFGHGCSPFVMFSRQASATNARTNFAAITETACLLMFSLYSIVLDNCKPIDRIT